MTNTPGLHSGAFVTALDGMLGPANAKNARISAATTADGTRRLRDFVPKGGSGGSFCLRERRLAVRGEGDVFPRLVPNVMPSAASLGNAYRARCLT